VSPHLAGCALCLDELFGDLSALVDAVELAGDLFELLAGLVELLL
jgi:hypothetical protein